MTRETTTFWTALPNGIVDGKVRISVFVTPKLLGNLGEDLKLSDYPIMKTWVKNVDGLKFQLFCKSGTNDIFQIGNGATYSPVNGGEFGLDSEAWDHIFGARNVFVEPEQADLTDSTFSLQQRENAIVDVRTRNLVVDKMVTESQILHTRLSLLNPGGSTTKPYQYDSEARTFSLKSDDRLVQLSQVPEDGFEPREFPSYDQERNIFSFKSASDISAAFTNDDFATELDGTLNAEPLSNQSIVRHYKRFCDYHRHGVKNSNYQIRKRRTERSDNPEFNFAEAEIYSIGVGDNGKLLEFAESMDIQLPSVGSVSAGFEVSVFYNPNEVAPEIEVDAARKTLEAFRRPDGTYDPLKVSVATGDTFTAGNNATVVAAFRGKTFVRSDDSQWIERPIEEQDFHSIVSGFGSYPILLRKLGFVFDLEFDESDIPIAASEFSIAAEPVFSGAGVDDLKIYPQWSMAVRNELKANLTNGLEVRSFSMAVGTDAETKAIGGVKVLGSAGVHGEPYVGHSLQDTDVAARKTFHKAISDGAPVDFEDPYRTTNAYSVDDRVLIPGSPNAAAREVRSSNTTVELSDEHNLPASRSTGISVFIDLDSKGAIDRYRSEKKSIDLKPDPTKTNVFWPKLLATGETEDLTFDDVVVGCKVDVFVSGPYENGFSAESEKWYPLCARQLTFSYGNKDQGKLGHYLAPADEFWLETAGNRELDEDGNVQLRVNDNLFRWDGWSLVAPHPSQPAPETGSDQNDDWSRSVDVTIKPEVVPISLPKLRYGRDYWFRTRAADLAGNGVHPDFANAYLGRPGQKLSDLVSTERIRYRRHDPISPPTLYALQPAGPGNRAKTKEIGNSQTEPDMVGPDKSDILIIRSGENIPKKLGIAEWLVLPPDTDFQEADWSGMLDGFKNPNTAHQVLVRYSKELPKKYEPNFLATIKWGSKIGTPYLPDGYAAGASFRYLPAFERQQISSGASLSEKSTSAIGSNFPVSFNLKTTISSANEPYSQSFKLELKVGERKSEFSSKKMKVQLPPGEQQLVMLSSYPDEQRLDHFCLVHWAFNAQETALIQTELDNKSLGLSAKQLSTEKATIQNTLNAGLHWPITPAKPVRLIHAVPKPVYPPEFSEKLRITNRVTGGNAVVMEDPQLKMHRVSTGKIDIFAEWDEYSDIPGDPQCPRVRRERRHCFKCDIPLPDCTIEPDDTHRMFDIGSRHNFPSNKHLAIKYVAVATTRYKEYFGEDITSDPENLIIESEPSCELHVYNTAPPPPPEVTYILPLFIWEKNEDVDASDGKPRKTIRRRAGFRIYMKRGWFRSGKDERLAVVLQTREQSKANKGQIPELTYPVTKWGSDPIWYDRNPITRQPMIDDFIGTAIKVDGCAPVLEENFIEDDPPRPNPTITKCESVENHCLVTSVDGVALPVPEMPAAIEETKSSAEQRKRKSREPDKQGSDLAPADEIVVDIAAYDVKCDLEKDMVYADVELEPSKAYMPFVKLALARYQHHSAKYCHLSSIVAADFVQLSPERNISVTRHQKDFDHITVGITVSGVSSGYNKRGHPVNFIEIYKLDGDGHSEQYPLKIAGEWNDSMKLFHWNATVIAKAGQTILLQEFEHLNSEKRAIFTYDLDV